MFYFFTEIRQFNYGFFHKEELLAVFNVLELTLAEPELTAEKIAKIANKVISTGLDEAAWEGFEYKGNFYAWAGSLLNLEDRHDVSLIPDLLNEIDKRGLKPRKVNKDKIGLHIERGLAQVFVTDRKTWRRPVVDIGQYLMVGNSKDG